MGAPNSHDDTIYALFCGFIPMKWGLLLSVATTVVWAIDTVLTRLAVTEFNAEPVLFSCLSLLAGACVLLIIGGGPGKEGLSTVRSLHTWFYGFLYVLMGIFYTIALDYTTTTEMSLIDQISILMSLILVKVYFKRRWYFLDVLGNAVIILCIGYIVWNLEPGIRLPATVFVALAAFCLTLRAAVTEDHPNFNNADNFREKCRVTGSVVGVTSFVSIVVLFVFAWLKTAVTDDQPALMLALKGMPSVVDFTDTNTLIGGIALGILTVSVSNYLLFSAVKAAKTEHFMMVMASLPFFTYAVEYVFGLFGWLDVSAVSIQDLMVGVVIMGAAVIMIFNRARHKDHLP